ncbi:MAG: protein kinase [Deltaproteobacteria bacterium]|nr:protein kinase [Deltaproteobacteria bacterium]
MADDHSGGVKPVETAAERFLFAICAVDMDMATAEEVAQAAMASEGGRTRLGEVLVASGVLTSEQRGLAEDRVIRSFGAGDATVPLRRTAEHPVTGPPAPIATAATLSAAAAAAAAEARLPLEHEGRYVEKALQGSGGQARVMLATDEFMGRDIALKILHERQDDEYDTQQPAARRTNPAAVRFLREARITARLEHPNIVPVHEVGRRRDGTLYYTMRLVRGTTLAAALAECSTLAERLKRLGSFWDACNAIAFAHSRGVVHRDIKPANMMVGEFGETVLLDWGIAKVEDPAAPAYDPTQTEIGSLLGTPAYMSPEQATGSVDKIDRRSDVWGLGAVLYQILTGKPPYSGQTGTDVITRATQVDVKPVRELAPEAPAELAAVAEKALQRDPDKRYQTAQDLAAEIDAYMTGGKVRAYEYTPWELLKRFAAHNKTAFIAAATVLVVIIGALVAVSLSLGQERQARQREATARAKEYRERLAANYNLSQAYAEKADRLAEDQDLLTAAIYAAASLGHNPAHPKSPVFDADFAGSQPQSAYHRLVAASRIGTARPDAIASLARVVAGKVAFEQVAFSPDGSLLAATEGEEVRLFDVATGKTVRTLKGHTAQTLTVAFSADGRRLASAGRDRTIGIWEVAAGTRLATLTAHGDTVHSVRFSPDGALLASGGYDRRAFVWDLATGKVHRALEGHRDWVVRVAFSPDGSTVATASQDRKVRFFGARDGRPTGPVLDHPDGVMGAAFAPTGGLLATGCFDGKVRLWDPRSGTLLRTLAGHRGPVVNLAFTPDGRLLLSAGHDKTARLWSAHSGRPILSLTGHAEFVQGVDVAADGATIATASFDRTIRLWRLAPGRGLRTFAGHSGAVDALDFSDDGKLLATGGLDKMVRLWRVDTGQVARTFVGHTGGVNGGVVVIRNGARLASAGRDTTVRVWDGVTGATLHVLQGHQQAVRAIAASPDGRLLASASNDRTVRLWEVEAGKPVLVLRGHGDAVLGVAFSPDGNTLASVSNDRTVRLWDAATGALRATLAGHTDWVSGVSFSPDGTKLATAGKGGLALVWDVATGKEIRRLVGHTQWVNDVRFSRDGKLLVTCSDDMTVRIWSAATGEPLLIVRAGNAIEVARFSPDGQFVAVPDANEVRLRPLDLTVMDADPTALLREAEQRAGVRLDGFELRTSSAAPP